MKLMVDHTIDYIRTFSHVGERIPVRATMNGLSLWYRVSVGRMIDDDKGIHSILSRL